VLCGNAALRGAELKCIDKSTIVCGEMRVLKSKPKRQKIGRKCI
jgi:hypothetical protein